MVTLRTLLLVLLATALLVVPGRAAGQPSIATVFRGQPMELEEVRVSDEITVYYALRTVGDVTIEGDFVVFDRDSETRQLVLRNSHWREDVPETFPRLIGMDAAAAIVGGSVEWGQLYLISPESRVFPLDPTPTNPCWVLSAQRIDGGRWLPIVDAVSGEILGEGVPPPRAGFSLTGPQEFQPCMYSWWWWAENARYWFEAMGYPTEMIEWPTAAEVKGHIQSDLIALFYELAHGDSDVFQSGCSAEGGPIETTSSQVDLWITNYEKVPFTFLGSCYGMCETGPGFFSDAFRKGSRSGAVTIGYCHMSDPICADCWVYSDSWQDLLFEKLADHHAVGNAFDLADAAYPMCGGNDCMRIEGDRGLTLVPPLTRTEVSCRVPDDYATIQAAIDAAGPRSVVRVAGGTYNERIVLEPYTRLVGGYDPTFTERDPDLYPTIVDGGAAGDVVACASGDHFLVEGFTLRNGGPSGDGVDFSYASGTVRNCRITGCRKGVVFQYGSGYQSEDPPRVEYCDIWGNSESGVELALTTSVDGTVRYTVIRDNGGDGITADGSSVSILNSTVAGNGGDGVELLTTTGNVVRDNIIASNGAYGIRCVSVTPALSYNDVWDNTSGEYSGCSAGTGDISQDPIFCDAPGGDYSVHGSSPSLGAGSYGGDMGALGIGCPAGPQSLQIAQDGASLLLSWSAPPASRFDVDHYVVYRDTMGLPLTVVATVDAPETTFVDVTISPCELNTYQVSAVDGTPLEGARSNKVTGELCYAGPTGLDATFTYGANELSWSPGEGPIDYYVIERGITEAGMDSVGWAYASDSLYIDETLGGCPRDNYWYRVKPVYGTGWRGYPSSADWINPAPAPPSGFTAEWSGDDVVLNWSSNCESDLLRYFVYRDTLPFSDPLDLSLEIWFTQDTTYVDVDLDTTKTYFYRLACNDNMQLRSTYSEMVYLGHGDRLTVPSPYATIQAAIDAASPIDTVLVSPGVYPERITMKDGVVVRSSGGPSVTTITYGSGTIVTASAQGDLSLLEGFTIDGQGTASLGLDSWVSSIRVHGCVFEELTTGLQARGGGWTEIVGCTFSGNQNGMSVADSAAPFLSGNVFDGNTISGVYMNGDPGPEIGRGFDDANDFSNSGFVHVFNMGTAEVDADLNYWGTNCPDGSLFYGPVDWLPWTDAGHTGAYTSCTGVDEGEPIGRAYASLNYPNPFNPSTAISYTVPSVGTPVRLMIYDLTGRKVRTLVEEAHGPGEYTAVWRGRDDRGLPVSSGVYFYRIEIGDYTVDRKMVMLK